MRTWRRSRVAGDPPFNVRHAPYILLEHVSNLLSVVEPAVPPASPVSPRPLLDTLLGALLGLIVAGGVAIVADYLDDAVKDPDRVQEIAGLSTLGTVARMTGDRTRSEIYRLAASSSHDPALRRPIGPSGPTSSSRRSMRPIRTLIGDELDPGRRQDSHGGQPGRRVRSSRPPRPVGGCGFAEARNSRWYSTYPTRSASRRCSAATMQGWTRSLNRPSRTT